MMRVLYPASNTLDALSDDLIALKIARHIPCSPCTRCSGLHPGSNIQLVRDSHPSENSLTDLVQYGSDEEDNDATYLSRCGCGHSPQQHGADEAELGREEYTRRANLALRIDQHLEVLGKLLDFAYSDAEVSALRDGMRMTMSLVSPLTQPAASPAPSSPRQNPLSRSSSPALEDSQPPSKRPRLSEEDDEDEDQPLAIAARMNFPPASRHENGFKSHVSRRGGKGTSAMSAAQTAPVSIPPPSGEILAEMNGQVSLPEIAVKMEEQMDEGQLDRLATGVTVDTAMASSSSSYPGMKPEKPSALELRKGVIQIIPVENDGHPRSHVILTNLKTLFRKQLPVMPREYIARLVFDSNSKCLAICKRGYKVVGGICYRPFPHRGFAEIVFFATASISQEKGYGGLLMDHFKAHIRRTYPDMLHFLTYADNFAVGYFKKQGFSKEITLDRSVWAGYIKDYEGGTIMQCTMLRRVDYTATREIIAQQREAVLAKIRQMSRSHEVYPGLPQFQDGAGEGVVVDYRDVPGLRESGWTPEMSVASGNPASKNTELSIMNRLLSEMQNHASSWPFREPVKLSDAADYYDVIEQPMDLKTMGEKLEGDKYANLEEFADDAQLIFDNCRFYNVEDSVWCKHANRLEKAFKESLARLRDL
ncbi:hypothetical protein EDB92DRAFT_1845494 [Lactarius akahatsu]|uniref:histone acetyltransferase n=1 Tax=Lactarius akahatsu TaxID=416441 RepID=A0AAD4LKY9_9AGAM|nr:hypothetical protein EDB92DRAFT_1845494 [Lactarius akahatsu]